MYSLKIYSLSICVMFGVIAAFLSGCQTKNETLTTNESFKLEKEFTVFVPDSFPCSLNVGENMLEHRNYTVKIFSVQNTNVFPVRSILGFLADNHALLTGQTILNLLKMNYQSCLAEGKFYSLKLSDNFNETDSSNINHFVSCIKSAHANYMDEQGCHEKIDWIVSSDSPLEKENEAKNFICVTRN